MMIGGILENITTPRISGMIKLLYIFVYFFCTIICSPLYASLGVHSSEDAISKCDTILVGTFTLKNDFKIQEVIKSKQSFFEGDVVKLYSPYSLMSFSMPSMIESLDGEVTIILGKWDTDKESLMLFYGVYSFWPQGVRDDYLPDETVGAIKDYILNTLRESDYASVDTGEIIVSLHEEKSVVEVSLAPLGVEEVAEVIEEVTAPEPATKELAELVVTEPIQEDVEQSPNWPAWLADRWLWLIGAVVFVGGILILRPRK